MPFRDKTSGYMPGQDGVLGVDYTKSSAKQVMSDSRLFYVNPNHPLAHDDGNTGRDQEKPFTTIAKALTLCRDNRGDAIFVGQNDGSQYGKPTGWITPIAEEITVTVHGVSIVGLSPGSTGVPWEPLTDTTGVAITVHAMDVLISGFNFFVDTTLECTAIECAYNGTTTFGDNTEICGCFFNEYVEIQAIALNGARGTHIHHNVFSKVNDYGIVGDGGGTLYQHIHDNTFSGCGYTNGAAIHLPGAGYAHIHDNIIWNEVALAAAPATDEGICLTGGDNNMVNNNYFSCVFTDTGANGDWGDFNTGNASDSWPANWCWNGMAVSTPS